MFKKLAIHLIFILCTFGGYAIEINVTVIDGSNDDKKIRAEKIQLLKFKQGMQLVESRKNLITTSFTDLKAGQPYMVQAVFKGINYNKVVPPSPIGKEIFDIKVKVFQRTNLFSNKISFRSLYSLQYVADNIEVLTLYHFNNSSRKTFTNNKKGMLFYLPANASQVEASVSVGSGKSDIQWLKLQGSYLNKKTGSYYLPYPLKPGERLYQVSYTLPYENKKLTFPIKEYYKPEIDAQILTEPKELQVRFKGLEKLVPAKQGPRSGQNLYNLKIVKDSLNYVYISEGTPVQIQPEQNVNVSAQSILTRTQRAIIAAILIILILGILWYFIYRKSQVIKA